MAYANVTVDPLLFAPERCDDQPPRASDALRAARPPWPRSAWRSAPAAAPRPPTRPARSRTSRPTTGSLQILVSVPADADVDLDGVTVTLDGKDASATAEPAAPTPRCGARRCWPSTPATRWRAERFEAAKDAAREFIDTVPDDVYVGIVTFDGEVDDGPDPDHRPRRGASRARRARRWRKKTRLYDGVIQAVDVAGTEGQRSVLVLSDGADTSDTPIDDGTTAIKDAEVLVDVVALEQSGHGARGAGAAGRGRRGPGDLRPTPRPCRRRSPPRPTSWPARCWSPPPCRRASTRPRPRHASRCRRRPAPSPPRRSRRSSPALRRRRSRRHAPGRRRRGRSTPARRALGLGLVFLVVLLVPRKQAHLSAADRVSRYTASQASRSEHRSGPLLDTDVAFASAKETAANVLRRNKDLDARISPRLEGAGSELKSSEWLLAARRHLLLSRPGRPAAGRRQPAHRLRSSSRPACSARGSTSASGAAGAARRSTRACPTRCS